MGMNGGCAIETGAGPGAAGDRLVVALVHLEVIAPGALIYLPDADAARGLGQDTAAHA